MLAEGFVFKGRAVIGNHFTNHFTHSQLRTAFQFLNEFRCQRAFPSISIGNKNCDDKDNRPNNPGNQISIGVLHVLQNSQYGKNDSCPCS